MLPALEMKLYFTAAMLALAMPAILHFFHCAAGDKRRSNIGKSVSVNTAQYERTTDGY